MSVTTLAGATPARVLVADDQPDVLEALRLLLRMHGYSVHMASSPAAVLQALGEGEPFDLLLMDLNYARDTTSGQEGLELVARVRAVDPLLPIMVMTAWSTVTLAVTTMREGVRDFVEKPWDNRRLLAAVQAQVASGRRARRAGRLERDAREVQRRLLGGDLPTIDGFRVGTAWQFAERLGGDVYKLAALPEERLGVAIADVCGKGAPAALLMASAHATLEDLIGQDLSPAEVCDRLGRALSSRLAPERFVSFAYAVLDRAAGTLTCANAGHPPPVLLRAEGSVSRLTEGGPVLGVVAGASYEQAVVRLSPGDRVVLFTDGLPEAAGPLGEEWGEERLVTALQGLRSRPAGEAAEALLAEACAFAQGTLADDATVVVVDVTA
jgi:sigma-B regulation protein RsbU (phosphoserine phosphatase)